MGLTSYDDAATNAARKTQGKVLIDKLDIKHIDVRFVNPEKLKHVTSVKKANGNRVTIIKDDVVDRLTIGSANMDSSRHIDLLQTSVLGKEYGNLICDNVDDLWNRLNTIKEHLLSKYGISISYDDAIVHRMEINKTIHLQYGRFRDYYRVLILLLSLIPEKEHLQSFLFGGACDYRNSKYSCFELESLYRFNNDHTYSVILYNKTEELKKSGIYIKDDFLRFEIKLAKYKLGKFKNLSYITDEHITDFYRDWINQNFIKPYNSWKESRLQDMGELFQKNYQENPEEYLSKSMASIANEPMNIPYILDFKDIQDALTRARLYDSSACGRKRLQRARDYIRKICEKDGYSKYSKYDNVKVNEIISKLYDVF